MKTPAISSVLKVARWEFVKNIKSPVFLVLTFVVPLIMVIVGGIGFFAERMSSEEELSLGVADSTEEFFTYLEAHLEGAPLNLTPVEKSTEHFKEMIQEEDLDAILLVEAEGIETGNMPLYMEDVRDVNLGEAKSVIDNAVVSYRMEQKGLDPGEIQAATSPVNLETRTVTGEEPEMVDFIVPLVAGMALIFSVLFSGQILMYGVIKEKRNRVVEILLSSISSLELMLGKIAGFGALSLCQIGIWLGSGVIVIFSFAVMPTIPLTIGQVILPVLFFIFGFLMLSSIFAAVGATMKEAEGGSQAQGMVILIPMVPIFLATPLLMEPNALWARILSHVPPFIPTTVLLRMGGTTLPLWEVASTLVVLLLSTVLFIYLGARIFEGTILQYDRPVGLKDLQVMFGKKKG